MTHRKKITKRTQVALLLVLGPTLLIFASLLILVVSNISSGAVPSSLPASCGSAGPEPQGVFIPSETCQKDLFGEQSPAQAFLNSLLFVISGVSILAWLPGLIIGLVLLIKRPVQPTTDQSDTTQ